METLNTSSFFPVIKTKTLVSNRVWGYQGHYEDITNFPVFSFCPFYPDLYRPISIPSRFYTNSRTLSSYIKAFINYFLVQVEVTKIITTIKYQSWTNPSRVHDQRNVRQGRIRLRAGGKWWWTPHLDNCHLEESESDSFRNKTGGRILI